MNNHDVTGKYPFANLFLCFLMTAFYAFIFFFISGHVEFSRLLTDAQTLNSGLWNGWRGFINNGGMRYFSWLFIGLTIILSILLIGKWQKYRENDRNILFNCLISSGVLLLFGLPLLLLLVLSDPGYALEFVLLFSSAGWAAFLWIDLYYLIRL